MYFRKTLFKVLLQFALITCCQNAQAQSIPTAPAELEFAGVTVQLTVAARQRLQQSLASLYADRALLLRQVEGLNQLRPLLDQRLLASGVPVDFRYACPPFPDLAADPYAYWGIDKPQTDQLRLLVNQTVDYRRHVLVVTDAVLPYLGQLQQRNNHWLKTLFEYFDPSAKLETKERDATHWLLDRRAPTGVWTTLARKIAFEQEQATLKFVPAFLLLEYDGESGRTLAEIASRLNINADRLTPYNTWLLADRIPTGSTSTVILRLTPEEYLTVKYQINSKTVRTFTTQSNGSDLGFPILRRLGADPTHKSAILYQINGRRGIQAQLCDDAITLAYYSKLPVNAFLKMNDLPFQSILRPGEVYYLERKAKRAKIPYHVVQQSQTLWDVSAIYGLRLKSLNHYNQLKPTQRVQAGRIVWMQRKRPRKFPVEYQTVPPAEKETFDEPTTATDAPQTPVDSTRQPAGINGGVPLRSDSVGTANRVPAGLGIDSLGAKPVDSIAATPPPANTPTLPTVTRIHVVKSGQTYFSVAKLYGISIARLYARNDLSERQPLRVGQELVIDAPDKTVLLPRRQQSVAVRPATPKVSPKTYYYTVKPGETVYRIALNNSVTVDDLMRWNGLNNFTIEVGQRLIVRK